MTRYEKKARKKLIRAMERYGNARAFGAVERYTPPKHEPVYRVAAILDRSGDDPEAEIGTIIVERDDKPEVRIVRQDGHHWVIYILSEDGSEQPVHARVMSAGEQFAEVPRVLVE